MKLNEQQIQEFDQSGYLFFPNAFSEQETEVLKQAANEVYQQQREEVWRETSGVARTAFAAHTYNDAFRRLGAHPRLINPVMQLLDGRSICTSIKSTQRLLLTAMYGNGIRITAPGQGTI